MNEVVTEIPIACTPHALSAEAWAAHQQRTEQLFRHQVEGVTEQEDGYMFRFRAELLPQVAVFVDGERQCCPFFHYTIKVPPGSDTLTLEITGSPQAKALLAQELLRLPA